MNPRALRRSACMLVVTVLQWGVSGAAVASSSDAAAGDGEAGIVVEGTGACGTDVSAGIVERTEGEHQGTSDLFVSGDFDGNGIRDEAFFVKDGRAYVLCVHMNDGRDRILLSDLLRIINTGIRKSPPGVYVDACTRGVGSGCRSDQTVEVELDTEALVLFTYESAAVSCIGATVDFVRCGCPTDPSASKARPGRPGLRRGPAAIQAMEHERGKWCASRLRTP